MLLHYLGKFKFKFVANLKKTIKNASILTCNHFNPVTRENYYLFTYYLNFMFILNILWVQNTEELTQCLLHVQNGMDHSITDKWYGHHQANDGHFK